MALLKFLQGPLQVSRPKCRFRFRVEQARAPRFCSAGAANSAAENGFLCGVYAGICRRFGRMSGSAPTPMGKDLAGTRCRQAAGVSPIARVEVNEHGKQRRAP